MYLYFDCINTEVRKSAEGPNEEDLEMVSEGELIIVKLDPAGPLNIDEDESATPVKDR